MPEKLALGIVKLRWIIIACSIILTGVCLTLIDNAVINYDFTDYLSEDTVTRKSLDIMNAEFGFTEQLTVMLSNPSEGETASIALDISALDGVMRASYDPAIDARELDGELFERVNILLDCEDAVGFAGQLENWLIERVGEERFILSGAAPQIMTIQENIAAEVPVAMGIAIIVVIVVLLITSHSYFEPVIFLIVLAVSIVINMGTNWIFDSISFVTFAVAAILQLALAMDYSIMLLHNYFDFKSEGHTDKDAMIKALSRSFMPISSSAFTTIAGLAALMFMSFTIGFDIGIVLSKGILISMLTVFTLMPAVALACSGALKKTMHKPLKLGGAHIARFTLRTKRVLPIALILVILASAYVQTQNEYTFTDHGTDADANRVSEVFGLSNQLVLLFPSGALDEDYALQRSLLDDISNLSYEGRPAVTSITSMVTTGADALQYITANDAAEMIGVSPLVASMYFGIMGFSNSVRADVLIDRAAELMGENEDIRQLKNALDLARGMFHGSEYARAILLLDVPYFGEDSFYLMDEISAALERAYPGQPTGIVGTTMSSYDISSAFRTDMLRVSLITIAAILLIIFLSFKNAYVPVILVCVIQGAIWVTMAISRARGESIFFMCYLICIAIQMGATIDYGILLTSHYRRLRKTQPPSLAIQSALRFSLPTIFTSGIILIVAGFAVGRVCTVYYIYSIGRMLARGACVSVTLVLVLLPALLVNMDKAVMRGAPPRETTRNADDIA